MSKETKHAVLGASGASRWLSCPGSVPLSKQASGTRKSGYALEGQAAHKLAELCITERCDADSKLGENIDGVVVDKEMSTAVQVYLDHVRNLLVDVWVFGFESEVNLDALTKFYGLTVEAFGTADFWGYVPRTRTLHVVDYKHGRGVPVPAFENAQLSYYGLGVLSSALPSSLKPKSVLLTIVQPRTGDPAIDSWEISASDLLDWGMNVLIPGMEAALAEAPPLRVGDWCRWCPAKPNCPALRKTALEAAQAEFQPLPPDAKALTDDQLGKVLDRAEVIHEWVKAVREEAFERAKRGGTIPGYKMVAKRATRKWTDPDEVVKRYGHGFPEILNAPTVRSVAQVEKVLPPDAMAALQDLIVKASSGETLVPVGSPRERVEVLPPGKEFSEVS